MGWWQQLLSGGGTRRRVNIEARFERLRSSVTGTMSNFFVARDREYDNRVVGVKLCDSEKVAFFESRFKGLGKPSEGEIAVTLRHPCVAETYEHGLTTKGNPYLVMEFVDGPGLQQLIANREETALAPHRLSLIRQMADALHYVHKSGYIHRDICPRNYICNRDLTGVKLIDFGLTLPAKPAFMQPGNRTGTPLYMAPEVVRRRETDQRVDVFAFGLTCYHLLTLELPWPIADTSGMAALQHDTTPPVDIMKYRPDLNRRLAELVMRASMPNVNQRLPNMEAFVSTLKGIEQETGP